MKKKDLGIPKNKPTLCFSCIIASIFTSEYIIIAILPKILIASNKWTALMDASLLTTILFPILYFYFFKPVLHENIKHKQTSAILQKIISNIPYCIFWKDENSFYLGCNEKFAKDAGIKKTEDIVGKTDYQLPWKKTESDFYIKSDKKVMEKNKPTLKNLYLNLMV